MMFKYLSKNIDESRRKKILAQIKENCDPQINFYLMTAFSAIIVTLGLVTDNTAVVIGGMIISPIFWPIIGIAMSIIRGSVYSFRKSAVVLSKALVVAVVFVLIFVLLYPLKGEPGVEVILRSSPNLFDLFIAFFVGLAGAFAIIWPGISSSLAGILVATTLMPAIGVMGYGISTLDYKIAIGALLLFLTNLVAIIFAAFFIFFLAGFRPANTSTAKQFLTKELIWTMVLLLLITIPLSYSLYNTVVYDQYERDVNKILLTDIPNMKDIDIQSINVKKNKNHLDINATIFSDVKLTNYEVDQIVDNIQLSIKKNVKLNLRIIPIIEVRGH